MPLFLHAVQRGHRLVNLPVFQIDGLDTFAPRDAQVNLVALITTGLLDSYPTLSFINAEMGAAPIKQLIQRLASPYGNARVTYEDDEGPSAASRRTQGSTLPRLVPADVAREKNADLPSSYFRRNFFWTIETEEAELAKAIDLLGAERFLFATDYPHDDPGGRMKFKDVQLLAANDRIGEGDKDLIRSGNAIKLFGLG
jgi:predicted TIM-barrel fold metal-dependent hydrolase